MAKEDAGSAQALRLTVNRPDNREILDQAICSKNEVWKNATIEWYSPIEPSYNEFQNGNFWTGILPGSSKQSFWAELQNSENRKGHKSFWPTRGAHWDALGILNADGERTLIIVEAKGQCKEHKRTQSAAKAKSSVDIINKSLSYSAQFLKSTRPEEWNKDSSFYQFENRLAYLIYLSEVCKIQVCLVYVYFLNDPHAKKIHAVVSSENEWKEIISEELSCVGLDNDESRKILEGKMIDVFLEAPEY